MSLNYIVIVFDPWLIYKILIGFEACDLKQVGLLNQLQQEGQREREGERLCNKVLSAVSQPLPQASVYPGQVSGVPSTKQTAKTTA